MNPTCLRSMPLFSTPLPEDRRYFLQLFISVLVSVGNGSIFCFGIFSPFMKAPAFSMNQTQINIVSTCGVVLSYFSLPIGFLFDRFGPKWTLMCGAVLNIIGWMGMFLIFYDMEQPLLGTSTAVICFFFGISQWTASFYETGSVLTNLEAMSLHQGRVVIIQKTFMGLGSSIITQIYIAFFQGRFSIATFFFFLAVFNSGLGFLGAFTIRLPTPFTRVLGLNYEGAAMKEDVSSATTTVSANHHGAQRYGAVSQQDDVDDGNNEVSNGAPVVGGDVADHCAASRSSTTSLLLLDAAKRRYDRAFHFGVGLLLVVVAFIVSFTIGEAYWTIGGTMRYVIGGITLGLLLLFALMVPLVPLSTAGSQQGGMMSHCTDKKGTPLASAAAANDDPNVLSNQPLTTTTTVVGVVGNPTIDLLGTTTTNGGSSVVEEVELWNIGTERIPPEALNNEPLQRNIRTLDIKLMWLVSFAVWGSGTVISSNSTQIYQALDFDGYTSALDSVYVSIYGVASAVGRIGVGFGDSYLKDRGLNVVRLFPIAPCINVLAIPLFFVLPAKALIVAFFLSGLSTGVTWGSTVLIIKSLFAPNNCGKHYNVLYTAGMLTPLLMNVALFGPLYDRQSAVQGLELTHSCSGVVCIEVPLLLSLLLNVAAIPCAVLFARRVIANRGLS